MLPQLTVIFTSFLEVSGGAVYTGNFSLQNYMNTLFAKDNNSITNTYLFWYLRDLYRCFYGYFYFLSYSAEAFLRYGSVGYGNDVPVYYSRIGFRYLVPVCL